MTRFSARRRLPVAMVVPPLVASMLLCAREGAGLAMSLGPALAGMALIERVRSAPTVVGPIVGCAVAAALALVLARPLHRR